jgi:osmoprotectant transport system substrate-binding protein
MNRISRRAFTALALAAGAAVALAGCASSDTLSGGGSSGDAKTIVVGSANFDESKALAEAYGQALEAKGYKVTYKLNIGARAAYIAALQKGEIDLVPEYAGSILVYLDKNATGKSSSDVAGELKTALGSKLKALDFSEAADADSLNVTSDFSKQNNVTSIGDLANLPKVSIAANPEFNTRPDGIAGLKSVYGLNNLDFQAINDSGGPATLKALLDGTVQVADIYTTTPSIGENNLVTLKDPKNLFASQQIVPIVSAKKSTSDLDGILNAVSQKLTTDDLQKWNKRMSGDEKASPETVAKDWLKEAGLS